MVEGQKAARILLRIVCARRSQVAASSNRLLKLQQPAVGDGGAIPEHFVVKHVVAAAEEIGPVAGLGDFEQAVVVAVQPEQPVHHALERFGIFGEQAPVLVLAHVEIECQHGPEAAVDGADAAHAAVVRHARVEAHVGRNLAVGREVVEERAQRGHLRRADVRVRQVDRADDGDRAVARPDAAIVDVRAGDFVVGERAGGEAQSA